jgi:two-component system, sensor histidine kinase and response regulator
MIEHTSRTPDHIMAVDDQPENLKLLEDMLRQRGYLVRSFPRGRLALAAASQHPPDLILLDINMPEMNGYEVCERLKGDERLRGIPVIFLSALSEIRDKVRAFRSGGVDYISKPFQVDEVQARVETHMRLHRLHRALQVQKDHLEDIVASRTRELSEAHARLTILDRAKTEFLNLISHELRTPLNGLIGIGELILSELESGAPGTELRDMFEQSRHRILSVIDDALLVTQIHVEGEKFTPAPISLGMTWNRAVKEVEEFAASRQVMLRRAPVELGLVLGEPDLTVKALRALLETAVKFSTAGEAIGPVCETTPDSLRLIIDSHGATLPALLVARFFDLLSISESDTAGGDVGLGPAVASRVLSLFGGSIGVENLERGIRLTVCFRPARAQTSPDISPLPSIA